MIIIHIVIMIQMFALFFEKNIKLKLLEHSPLSF